MEQGTVVDQRFVIEGSAGEGGMGEVYRGRDLATGAPVAVKVLRAGGEADHDRFAREASVLVRLAHPSIVAYLGHGALSSGRPYLAMEWVEGETLDRRLERGPLSPAESVALAKTLAHALAAAHALGVIHRDIKPGNVVLAERDPGRAKLIDFGIARVAGARAATATGALLGTPAYMAPEQIRGARDVDNRADLYSLGALLFECLAGRPPFVSEGHPLGVISLALFEPAPRLTSLAPSLPAELDALVASLLEKEPSLRPARAEAVIAALDAIALEKLGPRPVAPPRPSALTEHEMRLVTVVLLAASLAPPRPGAPLDETLVDHRDPKLVRAIERLAAPLGGQVEALGDGTVLVAITGRGSATDQAAAGARVALRIRALSVGRAIALTTGRGHASSGVLFSEAAARAGALARAGGPGDASIAVDETTRGLLDARFLVERRGDRQILEAEDPLGEPGRRLCGQAAPFVGREREIASIERLFEEVVGEPRAAAAVIVGEAGAGKSRLGRQVLSALARVDPSVEIWVARGDPVSAGAPFGMIAQATLSAASIREGDPPDARAQKLSAFVSSRVGSPRAERVAAFLGELVGATQPGGPAEPELRAARRDPVLMGDQIRLAFEDLVGATSRSRPVAIVLEDLHWGDVPTVSLLDQALRNLRASPVFVLALGRPEVLEIFPGLWAERGVDLLRLGGLSRQASTKLVRQILGGAADDAAVAAIVERGAGHPLFLEELVRAVTETSSIAALPETVVSMVQSRVERLPPEARRVLRAASIFGDSFRRDGVAELLGGALAPTELDRWLGFLHDRELIEARRDQRSGALREFTFRHALFREAAYAMLTPVDRALGHGLAGAMLEASGEVRAAVLAEHFDRAGEPQRAMAHHLRAAKDALEGGDFAATRRHVDRLREAGADGDVLGEALGLVAEAAQWQGAYEEAERLSDAAMAILARGSEPWLKSATSLAVAAGRRLSGDRLIALCSELQAIGESGDQRDAYVQAAVTAGLQAYIGGHYKASLRLLDPLMPLIKSSSERDPRPQAFVQMLAASQASAAWSYDAAARRFLESGDLFERAGDARGACAQRLDASFYLIDIGEPERAGDICVDLIATAGRLGLNRIASASRGCLGSALLIMGRHEEAREALVAAEREFDALGDVRLGGRSRVRLARCYLALGDLALADSKLDEAFPMVAQTRRFVALAKTTRARLGLARGDGAAALEAARSAMDDLRALGRMGTDEILVRYVFALALRAAGAFGEAQGALKEARERLLWMASCFESEAARAVFLTRVEENRRVLELAADLDERSADADAALPLGGA